MGAEGEQISHGFGEGKGRHGAEDHVVSLLPLCTNVLENAVLWNSALAKSRVNER